MTMTTDSTHLLVTTNESATYAKRKCAYVNLLKNNKPKTSFPQEAIFIVMVKENITRIGTWRTSSWQKKDQILAEEGPDIG